MSIPDFKIIDRNSQLTHKIMYFRIQAKEYKLNNDDRINEEHRERYCVFV